MRFGRPIKTFLLFLTMAESIYSRNFRQRRKENGLCKRCGNPLDKQGTYCISCRAIINENVRLDRKFYREMGVCPVCRKNNLFGDEKRCPECIAKDYEYTLKRREKDREHYNEVHRNWSKEQYKIRKEQGICTRCGKRKAEQGYKRCGICRAKDLNKRRIREARPDRRDRAEHGLCYFCDNPIKEGYKVCEFHWQKNVEYARSEKANEARKKLPKFVVNPKRAR